MIPVPRIFISAPLDHNLSPTQQRIKAGILRNIEDLGFEPLAITSGPWNVARVVDLIKRCHGVVIIGFSQWVAGTQAQPVVMPTEYNHFESAIAAAFDKEVFMLKDEAIDWRGAFYGAGGFSIVTIPSTANHQWVRSSEFTKPFEQWAELIRKRHHIFLGYSGAAKDTASHILTYLTSIGVRVRDWRVDFKPASVILDEIEIAAKTCLGGVFLFTGDDEFVVGNSAHAAPRDNVVFEAGYFMHAVGRERTLIIRESNAKMPADVGGGIYLELADRKDTSTIETGLRRFIETQL